MSESILYHKKLLKEDLNVPECTLSSWLTCVNEVGVYVEPGGADASWAAVGVGQAQVGGAQIAGCLCLG